MKPNNQTDNEIYISPRFLPENQKVLDMLEKLILRTNMKDSDVKSKTGIVL
jgi:hypothetical protein